MTKEEIENIDVKVFEEQAVVMSAEDYEKLWKYVHQLQEENEKQKKILDILKPHLKMVQDTNGLVGLDYDMCALITKDKQLINEWLEND